MAKSLLAQCFLKEMNGAIRKTCALSLGNCAPLQERAVCFFMLPLELQVKHSTGYEVHTVQLNGPRRILGTHIAKNRLRLLRVVLAVVLKSSKMVMALW